MSLGLPCKVIPEERSISNRVKGSQKQANAGEILSSCFFQLEQPSSVRVEVAVRQLA